MKLVWLSDLCGYTDLHAHCLLRSWTSPRHSAQLSTNFEVQTPTSTRLEDLWRFKRSLAIEILCMPSTPDTVLAVCWLSLTLPIFLYEVPRNSLPLQGSSLSSSQAWNLCSVLYLLKTSWRCDPRYHGVPWPRDSRKSPRLCVFQVGSFLLTPH